MWSVFMILFIWVCGAGAGSLVTQGPCLVNSTDSRRIHLKCANWYGAHQELFVVGGLECRSVSYLADKFKKTGANCARVQYSVEMAKYNPPVLPSSVAGIVPSDECASTARAFDVMDCVVRHLQERCILLICYCHKSDGTWVGANDQKYNQGLWNLRGFSSEDWV